MAGRVDGRVVVVTGAAQGIGAGIARGLAAEGAKVVAADLNADGAEATAAALEGDGVGVGVDVADRASVRAMIERAVEEYGRLDVIFNNAGVSGAEAFMEVTERSWDRIMRVNGLGVLIAMQEAARQFIAQGEGGKIVNTASIASRQGYPDFAHYCASKAAVLSLTQSGARAFAEHGIRVNAFAPGVVATPLWDELDRTLTERDSRPQGEAMAEFSEGILVGRAATPQDIVPTALFLASSDSDYMTGQVVMIDGGMVLA